MYLCVAMEYILIRLSIRFCFYTMWRKCWTAVWQRRNWSSVKDRICKCSSACICKISELQIQVPFGTCSGIMRCHEWSPYEKWQQTRRPCGCFHCHESLWLFGRGCSLSKDAQKNAILRDPTIQQRHLPVLRRLAEISSLNTAGAMTDYRMGMAGEQTCRIFIRWGHSSRPHSSTEYAAGIHGRNMEMWMWCREYRKILLWMR